MARTFRQWLHGEAESLDPNYFDTHPYPPPQPEPAPVVSSAPPRAPGPLLPRYETFAELRRTEFYEDALRTQNMMAVYPPNSRHRNATEHALMEINHARFRLNHIIRNALDPAYSAPRAGQMSAIKLFAEAIEQKMQNYDFGDDSTGRINLCLQFCHMLIDIVNKRNEEQEEDPVSSDIFRQLVLTHQCSIETIVFHNQWCHGGDSGFLAFFGDASAGLYYEIRRDYWV
jgi:hypothetical protein